MLLQIQYFHDILKENSFEKAAEKNSISLNEMDQNIQLLESMLGFALFKDRKNSAVLTEAGECFYNASLPWLASYKEFVHKCRKIAQKSTEALIIGIDSSYYSKKLDAAFNEFSSRHQKARFETVRKKSDSLFHLLRHNYIDIAIWLSNDKHPDNYEQVFLEEIPLYLEISRRHPLSHHELITHDDLKSLNSSMDQPLCLEQPDFDTCLKKAREEAIASGNGFVILGKPDLSYYAHDLAQLPIYNDANPDSLILSLVYKTNNENPLIPELIKIYLSNFA